MNSAKFLQIALIAIFFTGCNVAFSSNSPDNNHNDVARSETEITQNQSKQTTNRTGAKPATQAAPNAVCPDPAKPCHHREKHFDDWELSFRMPARLKDNFANKSAPFYAIILKTFPMGEDCDGGEFLEAGESERKQLQKSHADRKVFASYECPNMAAVNYDFEGRWNKTKDELAIGNFLAIYAGTTPQEAENLLEQLKDEYPDAVVKRMTAMYEKIVQ